MDRYNVMLAAVLWGTAACGPPPASQPALPSTGNPSGRVDTAPGPVAPIRTDRPVYTLRRHDVYDRYETWARVTYMNRGTRPVYMEVCWGKDAPDYEVFSVGPEPRRAQLTLECAGRAGVPRIEVPPGGTRTDYVYLVTPAARRPPEGAYLFAVPIYDRQGEGAAGELLPADQRQSNEFRVQYAN